MQCTSVGTVAHPCDRKLLMIRIPPQEQLNAAPVIGHAVPYRVHIICPRIFWKYFNNYFKMYVHYLYICALLLLPGRKCDHSKP